jgi:hypothetical protein
MALDIKKEMADIRAMYNSQAQNKSFSALVYGKMGTGKTRLAKTCRKPAYIMSFDPGGTKTVRDEIEKGSIVADTRFEYENPNDPTVAVAWDREYERLKKLGFFSEIGTLILDSGTTWASALMNQTLKKAGRPGGTPQQNDYLPTMVVMENAIKDICSLPCDFIFICHEDTDKDEASGRLFAGPLLIGKLKYRIPILFDEIYCAQTKETSGGVSYTLLTRSTGIYQARTRLGRDGLFEMYETPDIKTLLKKAGYSIEDKPY